MGLFIKNVGRGMKQFVQGINMIINTALLFTVYVVAVGPTSVVARIVGKKFLDKSFNKEIKSYWSELNLEKQDIQDYYRQF